MAQRTLNKYTFLYNETFNIKQGIIIILNSTIKLTYCMAEWDQQKPQNGVNYENWGERGDVMEITHHLTSHHLTFVQTSQ